MCSIIIEAKQSSYSEVFEICTNYALRRQLVILETLCIAICLFESLLKQTLPVYFMYISIIIVIIYLFKN